MTKYFKYEGVIEQGRILNSDILVRANYKELLAQIQPDEKLTATYDNGYHFVCPNLSSEKKFNEFENAYVRGSYIERDFYAMPFEPLTEMCSCYIKEMI